MVHVWPTLKIIVRRWFWTSKDVYWGAIDFFQIRRSWKSWGSQIFFSVKNIGSQLEINKILLGGYNILLSKCPMTTPMQIILSTLRLIGVALLVYDNTAVPRGRSYNFWLSNTGVIKILSRYLWKFMNSYSKEWWLHNLFIYVFLINQILRNIKWFQRNWYSYIYIFIYLFFLHLLLLSWCIV